MNSYMYLSTAQSAIKNRNSVYKDSFSESLKLLCGSNIISSFREDENDTHFEVHYINEFLTKCNQKRICELFETTQVFVKTHDPKSDGVQRRPQSGKKRVETDIEDMERGLKYTENNNTSNKGPSPFTLDRYGR